MITAVWSDVLEVKNGRSQKAVVDSKGVFPILGSGGKMGLANDYLNEGPATIIGRKGSINSPYYVEGRFWNVDTAFALISGKNLDPKYLYYFCVKYNFLKHNKATTLPSLTKADLLKIQIPLPSLPEQRRIAARLDAADRLRQLDKALVEKYDELKRSLFLEMFGELGKGPYQLRKVKDVCEKIVDCVNKTAPTVDYETDYKMIRTTNIRNGRVSLSNCKYVIKEVFYKWNSRAIPTSGDVLFTREAPLGEIAILRGKENVFLGQRTMLFRPNLDLVNSEYLQWSFSTIDVKEQLRKLAIGSTVKHISVPKCGTIEIKVPPIDLQHQFAEYLSSLNRQQSLAHRSLACSEEIFQGMLGEVFW